MATRGAVAASTIWKHRRNLSLRSLSHHFNSNFTPRIIPTGTNFIKSCVINSISSMIPKVFHYIVLIMILLVVIKYQVRAIQGASVDPVVTPLKNREEPKPQNWKIKMLYDGDCPLCMREVNNMLKERNEKYGTIKFVDISPEDNQGLDYKTVMGQIHAIESDGNVVIGVEAFRRLYEEVGLGWVYTITKFEPIGKLADAVYDVWAKYRLQVTGRPSLEAILEARKKDKVETCGDNKACKM
ncbi:unnamed protein product [Arabidopsis halleri]